MAEKKESTEEYLERTQKDQEAMRSIREMAWDARYQMERQALRDRFAMAALTGLANRAYYAHPDQEAKQAYKYADAMLKAREVE